MRVLLLKESVRSAVDVEHKSCAESTETSLYAAARLGDTEIVSALLEAGATVDAGAVHGMTPLMAAACHGNLGSLKALLAGGAAVGDPEPVGCGYSALMWASTNGHARQ